METFTWLDEDTLVISDHPRESEVESHGRPSADEDVLIIADEPRLRRAWRRGWRVVGLFCLGCVAAGCLILISRVIVASVRHSWVRQCDQQLDQIGAALHEYLRVQDHLPAPALVDGNGKPLLSWRVAILPQLGHASLYARFHLNEPWDSPHNLALLREMPKEFACPGGPGRRTGQTGYLVVVGPKSEVGSVNTPFEPTRGAELMEITDGTSNTILVIETNAPVPWTSPEDLQWAPDGPLPQLASPHDGERPVLLADGSSRFLKSSLPAATLLALLTKNGGEVISGSG